MRSPSAEYSGRLDACLRIITEKRKLHLRFGNAKLLVIVAALVLAWLAIYPRAISAFWLLLPAAVYTLIAVLHNRVNRARARAETMADFYHRGIARIEDRWAGSGETGGRFRNTKSIYAEDLDLFGPGSLFELVSTARTAMGERRLADWLLTPSPAHEILERHTLVAELREKLELREDLAVAGGGLGAALDPDVLARWAAGEVSGCSPQLRWVFATLALLLVASIVLLALLRIILPFLLVLTLEIALTAWLWKRAKAAFSGADWNDQGLLQLAAILKRIEQEPFTAARLQRLAATLQAGGVAASRSVEQLAHLANWINARDSLFVRVFDIPVMYTMQVGFATEGWRRRCGRQLGSWLEVIGEIEALLSLACYAYEHPGDPFPALLDPATAGPVFAAEEIGHPLLPASQCVRNGLRLGRDATQVMIVSGSNMSGKSTLLRAVGVNTVLAMAGAPVRAKSLSLTPLVLGTSIRTTDSLQEGRSGFYTEILRLREVFELADPAVPVLFLFDELLAGTNSTDRRAGAEGLVRELIGRGAIGIVTTHDIALTAISASPFRPGSIANAHFQERIDNGQMSFDYKLRAGVVEKGNALELMRMIGLKV